MPALRTTTIPIAIIPIPMAMAPRKLWKWVTKKLPSTFIQALGSGRFGQTLGGVVRYLITGGAGFIGSHLAERLLEKGEQVVLLDNLSTGSMENIRHLKGSDRLEYHLDGIENRQMLAELVDDTDDNVHLAAAVGVKLIVESPVRTIETNVNGTQMI